MKIAIIGGGAAGMMAAATLCENNPDAELVLLEKGPKLGQKVLISGGGRCNVTTAFSDPRLIVDRYPRGGKFLQSAFHRFSPNAVRDWFESHGVPLKEEADGRVFPESDDGADIVGLFEAIFLEHHIQVGFKQEVTHIEKQADHFLVHMKRAKTLEVDKVILTTGGQAYRHTGSTGDGYAFAEALGHSITKLAPSLNAFIVQEPWVATLAGISLKKVGLSVKTEKTLRWAGPILWTHKGLTGPAVFALSSLIAFQNYSREKPLEMKLDLLPELSRDGWEKALQNEQLQNPKKHVHNTLALWMPHAVAQLLCEQVGILREQMNAQVSKKSVQKIVETVKALPVHLIGRAAGEEFVTAGGVDTDEINPRTMESKLCPGLFFAGEIMNVDGFTGGFNLQAAWATGRMAGENASPSC